MGEDKEKRVGMTRRSLVAGVAGIAALAGLGCAKFSPSAAVVRPPGGQDEQALLASCIRCEKCVEVCPRSTIKLEHIEDGILAMRTPQMNFYRSYCDFCEQENGGVALCAAACPTGALDPARASGAVIGKASLTREWCLAYLDTGCHFCYDACPYGAIELDDHRRPFVIAAKCNGCGACESVCVSLTEGSRSMSSDAKTRAIVVTAEGAQR